ncbi:ornithine decarboxylase isoform X3 [Lingula anatina]|uniref:ornithine decarboxylase n=1 Tax=Lingula anatina TaxID=7574 RepID=A0A1S3JEW7_LINAN|nr:ornithine decarboxylase isoform X3 [Lingula anatina]|eukprot:XP_013408883.1 ornithine decarboxylase isoform X3 [Lingula anatina]
MTTVRPETTQDIESIPGRHNNQAILQVINEKILERTDRRPFYIVNLNDIVNKHKHWVELMPRVKPFYAVKCNNTEPVVKTIAALGAGFDCSNSAEFQQVLTHGVGTDRIIYAHPCKDPQDIKRASEQGVDLMTFDNEYELVKIKNLYPDARLVLRIHPRVDKTSFHIGDTCFDSMAYQNTIRLCHEIFDEAKAIGYNFSLLDIGGGFPGYAVKGKPTFADVAKDINTALDEYFPKEENVVVIAEPGTYYVQSAFTLALRVIGKRVLRSAASDMDHEQSFLYYLNDGIHGSFFFTVLVDKAIPGFRVIKKKRYHNKMTTARPRITQDIERHPGRHNNQAILKVIQEKIMEEKDRRPFYIVNLDDIVNKHKHWVKLMPRVKPFYAVKCNNTEPVVKTIAALGAGFDCASSAEFQQVLNQGVGTDRIIYAHPCKDPQDIKRASEQGVDLMTFDNKYELIKIQSLFPDARLVLRICPQVNKGVYEYGEMYGCAVDQCKVLLEKAKEMTLVVVGVSFHIGGFCFDSMAYQNTIRLCREIFDEAKAIGYNFSLLDIGGGFPGYAVKGKPTFADVAKDINTALDEYFPKEENVVVIAEPGTYYVQSAFTLALRVIGKRVQRSAPSDKDPEQSYVYYLNDGMHGAFLFTMPSYVERLNAEFYVFKEKDKMPVYQSTLWGPTLSPTDLLVQNILLPELDIGDWLYVPNMGAYTTVLATSFNGIARPELFCLVSDEIKAGRGI